MFFSVKIMSILPTNVYIFNTEFNVYISLRRIHLRGGGDSGPPGSLKSMAFTWFLSPPLKKFGHPLEKFPNTPLSSVMIGSYLVEFYWLFKKFSKVEMNKN